MVLTDKLNIGGYDLVAYNFATNMNREKFEFIFLVRGKEKGLLEDTVTQKGFRVIHQSDETKSYFKSYFYLKKLFKEERFDVVHSHLNFFSGIVMRAAYKSGVKVRAAHAHFTDPCIENRSRLKKTVADIYESIMRRWFKRYCNLKIGCGYEAGCYLFGKDEFEKNGVLLNNGVDTERFSYQPELRNKTRKELNAENKIIIGHCGRFNYVKNHKFLVDVFAEYKKLHPDSLLLLVGDGGERKNIESKAEKLGIIDSIVITGLISNTEDYYNAMDCFVFPSIHEGFPLTLVEAQATKLPCLISSEVTRASGINENTAFLPLNETPEIWVNKIDELLTLERKKTDLTLINNDFSIKGCSKKLEELYEF